MTYVCLTDLERAARDVLPGEIWDFLAGGSGVEASLVANRTALERILPLSEYLEKLDMVLGSRTDLVVVARTDATDEAEILRRAEALAASGADVILVDGVRSVEWIRKIRGVIGDKPLLFNQIAGGKSPRLSLSELTELGVDVTIYSTPCLFAAHSAIDKALTELKIADGRLPEHGPDSIGVAESLSLLERNISRRHTPVGAANGNATGR